jgi:DNA repair protein RecN (Recombination protein N)
MSANAGEDLRPIAKIASGGELARIMLALKNVLAEQESIATLVFDEVDTGVSGDIANKMGDIMHELGTKMQVMAITHLPQIASKGNAHYYVFKKEENDRTITQIKQMDTEERVIEIARMLSGAALTEASMANARDLLGVD